MIRLDARLKMVADLVVPGRKAVDVGTDHALLPAFLLLSGKCTEAVASDIKELPLKNAKRTIERYSLEDKISLRLSNGFENIEPHSAEEIIIAGMGGTVIAEMLDKTPWLKNPEKHLIIQPMTRAEEARMALCRNGFKIDRETAVRDEGRIYIAISTYYSGEHKEYKESYYYIGELANAASSEAIIFLHKQAARLKKRATALENIGECEEARRLEIIINDIMRIK